MECRGFKTWFRGYGGFAKVWFIPRQVNVSTKVNMWESEGVEITRIGKGLTEQEEEGGGLYKKGLLWFTAALGKRAEPRNGKSSTYFS